MFPFSMFPFYISFPIFPQKLTPIFSFKAEDDLFEPDKSENKDKNSIAIEKNQSYTVSELIPDIIIPRESYLSPSQVAEQLIQVQKQKKERETKKKQFSS